MASGGKNIKYKKSLIGPNAPEYLKLAADDVGLKETTAMGNSNPVVEDYIQVVTGKKADARSTPWCAYWVGAKLEEKGVPSTKSGMARSYLNWGTKVEEEDWQQGDIIVFWRGRTNDGVTGHVGFLIAWDEDSVIVLGGNQGDQVCFQDFSKAKILGVRRPRAITKSRTIKAALAATASEVAKPAVDAIPDPTSIQNHVEKAQEAVSAVQPVIDTIGAWKPYIKLGFSLITVALALLIVYYRMEDSSQKGRT